MATTNNSRVNVTSDAREQQQIDEALLNSVLDNIIKEETEHEKRTEGNVLVETYLTKIQDRMNRCLMRMNQYIFLYKGLLLLTLPLSISLLVNGWFLSAFLCGLIGLIVTYQIELTYFLIMPFKVVSVLLKHKKVIQETTNNLAIKKNSHATPVQWVEQLDQLLEGLPSVYNATKRVAHAVDTQQHKLLGTPKTRGNDIKSIEEIVLKVGDIAENPLSALKKLVLTNFPSAEKIFFVITQTGILLHSYIRCPDSMTKSLSLMYANSLQHVIGLDHLVYAFASGGLLSLANSVKQRQKGEIVSHGDYDGTILSAFREFVKIIGSMFGYKPQAKIDYNSVKDLSATFRTCKDLASVGVFFEKFIENVIDFFYMAVYKVPYKRDEKLLLETDNFNAEFALISDKFANVLESVTYDPTFANQVFKLHDEGVRVANALNKKNIPSANWGAFNVARRVIAESMPILKGWEIRSRANIKPFSVLIKGDPGLGKTMIINLLSRVLYETYHEYKQTSKYPEWNDDLLWNRSTTANFDDGYANQFATLIDDFGQNNTAEALVEQMNYVIHASNPTPMIMNMAALEQKGATYFTSKLLFVTTNQTTNLGQVSGLKSVEAFYGRFEVNAQQWIDSNYLKKGKRGWDAKKARKDFGEHYFIQIVRFDLFEPLTGNSIKKGLTYAEFEKFLRVGFIESLSEFKPISEVYKDYKPLPLEKILNDDGSDSDDSTDSQGSRSSASIVDLPEDDDVDSHGFLTIGEKIYNGVKEKIERERSTIKYMTRKKNYSFLKAIFTLYIHDDPFESMTRRIEHDHYVIMQESVEGKASFVQWDVAIKLVKEKFLDHGEDLDELREDLYFYPNVCLAMDELLFIDCGRNVEEDVHKELTKTRCRFLVWYIHSYHEALDDIDYFASQYPSYDYARELVEDLMFDYLNNPARTVPLAQHQKAIKQDVPLPLWIVIEHSLKEAQDQYMHKVISYRDKSEDDRYYYGWVEIVRSYEWLNNLIMAYGRMCPCGKIASCHIDRYFPITSYIEDGIVHYEKHKMMKDVASSVPTIDEIKNQIFPHAGFGIDFDQILQNKPNAAYKWVKLQLDKGRDTLVVEYPDFTLFNGDFVDYLKTKLTEYRMKGKTKGVDTFNHILNYAQKVKKQVFKHKKEVLLEYIKTQGNYPLPDVFKAMEFQDSIDSKIAKFEEMTPKLYTDSLEDHLSYQVRERMIEFEKSWMLNSDEFELVDLSDMAKKSDVLDFLSRASRMVNTMAVLRRNEGKTISATDAHEIWQGLADWYLKTKLYQSLPRNQRKELYFLGMKSFGEALEAEYMYDNSAFVGPDKERIAMNARHDVIVNFYKGGIRRFLLSTFRFVLKESEASTSKMWDYYKRPGKKELLIAESLGVIVIAYGVYKVGNKLYSLWMKDDVEQQAEFGIYPGDQNAQPQPLRNVRPIKARSVEKQQIGPHNEIVVHGFTETQYATVAYNVIMKNIVPFRSYASSQKTPLITTQNGCLAFIEDRKAIIPKHYLYDIIHDETVSMSFEIYFENEVFKVDFSELILFAVVRNDIAVVEFPSRCRQFRSIMKHVLRDDEIPEKWGELMILAKLSTKNNGVLYHSETTIGAEQFQTFNYSMRAGAQKEPQEGIFLTNLPSRPGLCGALWLTIINKRVRIMGIHTCGSQSRGGGTLITRHFLMSTGMFDDIDPQSHTFDLKYDAQPGNKLTLENYGWMSKVPKEESIEKLRETMQNGVIEGCVIPRYKHRFGGKSELRPTLLAGLVTPSVRFPAHLSGKEKCFDPTCCINNGISPLYAACKKAFGRPEFDPSNETKTKSFEVMVEILNRLPMTNGSSNSHILNWEEMINGGGTTSLQPINRDGSMGFPLSSEAKKKGMGKHDWITFDGMKWLPTEDLKMKFIEMENALMAGLEYPVIFEANLKDELRSKHTTRLFYAGPFCYTLILRKYFGRFIDMMHTNHIHGFSHVGINPTSLEWQELYSEILKFSEDGILVAGDFSGFDVTISRFLKWLACCLISLWMVENYPDGESFQTYMKLLSPLMDPRILVGDVLVLLSMIVPSGHGLTTILNTLMNVIIIYTSVSSILKDNGIKMSVEQIIDCVIRVHAYGDDNLNPVKEEWRRLINLQTLSKKIREIWGMEYTDYRKHLTTEVVELHHIDDVEFLKRQFVHDEIGYVHGALNKEVIIDLLNWQRVDNLVEGTMMNATVAMDEAFHWGPQFYIDVVNTIKVALYQKQMGHILKFRSYKERLMEYIKGKDSNIFHSYETEQEIEAHSSDGAFMDDLVQVSQVTEQTQIMARDDDAIPVLQCEAMHTTAMQGRSPYPTPDISIMRRSSIIYFTWTTSQMSGTVVGSMQFPGALLSANSMYLDIIKRFQFFRAGIKLTFRTSATPHHMGVIAIFHANGFPAFNTTMPSGSNLELLYKGSCMPTTLLYAGANNKVELIIPYRDHNNFLDMSISDEATFRIGFCSMVVLHPLVDTTGGTSPITISVTMEFVDPQVAGPCPLYVPVLHDSAISFENNVIAHGRRKTVASKEIEQEGKTGVLTAGLSTASGIAKSLAPIIQNIPVVGAIGSMASPVLDIMAKISDASGYDKPTTANAPERVLSTFVENMSLGTGLDYAQKLTYTPQFSLATTPKIFGDSKDFLQFENMKMLPSLIKIRTLTGSSTVGPAQIVIPVTPTYCPVIQSTYSNGTTAPPVSYLMHNWVSRMASNFELWSGSMKYVINIATSALISGELQITWIPENALIPSSMNSENGNIVTRIVKFSGNMSIPFMVPQMTRTPWLRCLNADMLPMTGNTTQHCTNGKIIISLASPLAYAFDAAAVTVYVSVWQSGGESLVFSSPRNLSNGYSAVVAPILQYSSTAEPKENGKEEISAHGGKTYYLTFAKAAQLYGSSQGAANDNSKTLLFELCTARRMKPPVYSRTVASGYTVSCIVEDNTCTVTDCPKASEGEKYASAMMLQVINGESKEEVAKNPKTESSNIDTMAILKQCIQRITTMESRMEKIERMVMKHEVALVEKEHSDVSDMIKKFGFDDIQPHSDSMTLCMQDMFAMPFPALIEGATETIVSGVVNELINDWRTIFHRYTPLLTWTSQTPISTNNEGYFCKGFSDDLFLNPNVGPLSHLILGFGMYRGSVRYKLIANGNPGTKAVITLGSAAVPFRNYNNSTTSFYDISPYAPDIVSTSTNKFVGMCGMPGNTWFDIATRPVVEFEAPYISQVPFEMTYYQGYDTVAGNTYLRIDRKCPIVSLTGATSALFYVYISLGEDFSVGQPLIPVSHVSPWNGETFTEIGGNLPDQDGRKDNFSNNDFKLKRNVIKKKHTSHDPGFARQDDK